MIKYDCYGQPYIDPLHKFTIEDWKRAEEAAGIADIISTPATEALTLETMMAAIEKLGNERDYSSNIACFGDYRVQKCEWMKGMDVVVLCGDKAYCWPDGIGGKEVKVIRLPEPPKTELSFKWDFETTIKWD
jgi:hypothetical protein